MSIQANTPKIGASDVPRQRDPRPPATPARSAAAGRALAALRVAIGLTFLWAFLDKTFGLGYATSGKQAWINGGSPTKGFLAHVQVGPLQGLLRDWAGAGWADWLFMIGLLGIGVALTLGIGMRIAGVAGTVLLAMMWFATWPLARHTSAGAPTSSTNPVLDEHLILIIALVAVVLGAAGTVWGLGRWWNEQRFVRANPWLR